MFVLNCIAMCSRAGTATVYGQDGPGIESRRQDFPHPSTLALGLTQSPIERVEGHPWGKRPGCGINHPPQLALGLKEKVELCL